MHLPEQDLEILGVGEPLARDTVFFILNAFLVPNANRICRGFSLGDKAPASTRQGFTTPISKVPGEVPKQGLARTALLTKSYG